MRTIGHFIGGREVKGTSGRYADVFEPSNIRLEFGFTISAKDFSQRSHAVPV